MRDLERVLSSQFETSLDAGVAREAALEASLARRLEVTDARLIKWAGAPAATVTSPDETSQHVEVADGAQAKRIIDELFARGAQVYSFKWKADGVTVVLSRCDLSSTTPEPYPPWLPHQSAWPCLGDCAARSKRILEKRDLLTPREHFASTQHTFALRRIAWRSCKSHGDPMNDTIVVFGAGQIGSQVTEPLLAAGHRVRQVRRSGQASTKGALEVRVGDLSDLSFAKDVSAGAKALIQPRRWRTT